MVRIVIWLVFATGPWRVTQVSVGSLTVLGALATVALYVMVKGHAYHQTQEYIRYVEIIAYIVTVILSLSAEIVAEL